MRPIVMSDQVANSGSGPPDELIRLNDVPRLAWLPRRRGGSRLAIATIHRWCNPGIHGHQLHFVRVGGVRCTTEAWLRQFFAELARAERGPSSADSIETQVRRDRRANAAAAQLQKESF